MATMRPDAQPVMKLNDSQMRTVREPLLKSGFKLAEEDAVAFYTGRNPL